MTGKAVCDTRFFIEFFYSKNRSTLNQLKDELRKNPRHIVSAVTLYETHRINLHREGKTVAKLRSEAIRLEFTVIPLDYDLSLQAAQIGEKHRTPLADSVIAATALHLKIPIITDDPHFDLIDGVKTRWPVR